MQSALEGETFAIHDNLIDKTFTQLEMKGCQRSHYDPEDELLGSGNSPRFDTRLPQCLTNKHFCLLPVDRRIPCRRLLYEVNEFRDSAICILSAKEKSQNALAHILDNRRLVIIPSRISTVEITPHFLLEPRVTENHRMKELPHVSARLSSILRP